MINKKIAKAINQQINAELYSSYLYLALSAYYAGHNLLGFAGWLKKQAAEEITHAMKFYDFLLDRNGRPSWQAIDQPPAEFGTVVRAFRRSYEHECKVTGLIHKLYELAKAEKDYSFEQFLHWFIDEQVEEEAQTLQIAETLEQIGEKGSGIFMLDHQLGKRDNKE